MKSVLIPLGLRTASRELCLSSTLSVRLVHNSGPISTLTKDTGNLTPRTILGGGYCSSIRLRDTVYQRCSYHRCKNNLHKFNGALHHNQNPYSANNGFLKTVVVDRSPTPAYFGTSSDGPDRTMSAPSDHSEKSSFVVSHDEAQKMFFIKLTDPKGESVAKLEYEWVRNGLVDLHHTETPPAFQGKGIAKVLVLAGLDHFCDRDVLIRPTCTYVQKVLRENLTPRYREHVEASYLDLLQS